MAKYEKHFTGDFQKVLELIDEEIIRGSMSATLEDTSEYSSNGVRCAVHVFERYSIVGNSRLSLNVTLLGNGDELFLSGISSGGSMAIRFKINTIGEEAFLKCLVDIIERYEKGNI